MRDAGVCLTRAGLLKRGVIPLPHESSMLSRYTRPEMAAIWESQTRFKICFEIEAHAADALADVLVIPKEAAHTVWAKCPVTTCDAARTEAIGREPKHAAIASI